MSISTIFAAFAFWLACLSCAPAETQSPPWAANYWVSKIGSDNNDCSPQFPCLTATGAISKAPPYVRVNINLGPGTYEEQINVAGYMHPYIGIYGPVDQNGNCISSSSVTIKDWVASQSGHRITQP
jgi:hypothetical protein